MQIDVRCPHCNSDLTHVLKTTTNARWFEPRRDDEPDEWSAVMHCETGHLFFARLNWHAGRLTLEALVQA